MPDPRGFPSIAPYDTSALIRMLTSLAGQKSARSIAQQRALLGAFGQLGGAIAGQQRRGDVKEEAELGREHELGKQRVTEGSASARFEAGQERADERARLARLQQQYTAEVAEAGRDYRAGLKADETAARVIPDAAAKAEQTRYKRAKDQRDFEFRQGQEARRVSAASARRQEADRRHGRLVGKDVAARGDRLAAMEVRKRTTAIDLAAKQTRHLEGQLAKLDKRLTRARVLDPDAVPSLERQRAAIQQQHDQYQKEWFDGSDSLRQQFGDFGVNFAPPVGPQINVTIPTAVPNDDLLSEVAGG
jgi:hypothetical protein